MKSFKVHSNQPFSSLVRVLGISRRTQLWIHVSCLLYLMLNAECSSKVRSLGPPSNFDVSARVVELKDERMFRAETLKTQLAVVYFYATECSPCMNFEPRFEELVRKCNDLDDVNFIKVEAGKFKVSTRRERLKLALYLRLKKRKVYKICPGRFYGKLRKQFHNIQRMHFVL